MYEGLKHSSCSQYISGKGYTMDEVQMMTDHSRRESIKRYASVQLDAKRKLEAIGRKVYLFEKTITSNFVINRPTY